MKHYIVFAGPMHSGKTTMAGLCQTYLESYKHTVALISLATGVKNIARQMGWNGQKDKKGRRLLQLLGTECGRECISQTLWADKFIENAKDTACEFIIADDCRFNNEVEVFRVFAETHPEWKVTIIKITGRAEHKLFPNNWLTRLLLISNIPKPKFLLHRSEWGIDGYDFELDNSGTIAEGFTHVRRIIDHITL